jgi:hypothetical protein
MIPQWDEIHHDLCLLDALNSFIAFIYVLNTFIVFIALNTFISFHYYLKYHLLLYALNTFFAFTMWIIAFISVFTTLL